MVFVERVCFRDIHKNKEEVEQFGLQNTKTYGAKIYSRRHVFRAKVYKSNVQAKRWHSKTINNRFLKHNFACASRFLFQSKSWYNGDNTLVRDQFFLILIFEFQHFFSYSQLLF